MFDLMNLIIGLAATIIYFTGLVILTFSIFKIPIKHNDKQITIMALVLGTVNYYLKFILHSPFSFLVVYITFMVLLLVLRRYPIFYSFIVSSIGLLAAAIFDGIVTYGALRLNLSTIEQILSSASHMFAIHFTISLLYILFSYILVRLNTGFSFIKKRFAGVQILKLYNFIWAWILILGTSLIQFISMKGFILSIHGILLAALSISLFVSVIYAIKENKKSLRDRYGG